MRTYDGVMLNAGDLSQATLTSPTFVLDHLYGYAIQCVFIGGATGTLSVQGSCDPGLDSSGTGVTNWSQVSTNPLAAPGSVMFNVDAAHYKWLRLVYTRTAGAGSITARMHAKGI